MKENNTVFSLAELVTLITSISLLSSILFFGGFSISSKLPVIRLMRMNDFITSALPWLIPTLFFSVIAFILGIFISRLNTSEEESKSNRADSKISFPSEIILFLIFSLIITTMKLIKDGFSIEIIISLFPTILIIVFIILINCKSISKLIILITPKYFLVLIFMLSCVCFSFSEGYRTGLKGEGLFNRPKISNILLKDSNRIYTCRILFSVGDFLLIYDNESKEPILKKKDLISKILIYDNLDSIQTKPGSLH